jgi:Zn-dependent protease with chaperone function
MKKILTLITLIIFLSSTLIFAQQRKQPPIWDIRAMAIGNGVVNLTVDGSTYASIPRADAKAIIDILDNISSHSGIYPERVNLVGQNILNASAGYINGVATINIYKPMFDIFIKDKDLAAFTLGHEMGHLYFRHGENAKSIQAAGELVALIAGSVLSVKTGKKYGNPQLGADIGSLLGTAVATSFTRDQERESDKIGLEWMIKNGYNPEGAVRLFTAFQRMGGNNPIPFFQTHPNPGERMDNVKAQVAAYYAPKNTTPQTTVASNEIKQETTKIKTVAPVAISDEVTKLNALIDEEKLNQYPKTENGRIAITALAKKDYAQAKTYLEKCSEEGEAVCINNLGVLYQLGLGVTLDLKKALQYYKQAADKGLSTSMYNYAALVTNVGEGTKKENSEELFKYMIKAAEQGSPRAMGKVASISQIRGIESVKGLDLPSKDVLVNYAKVSAMRGVGEGQAALGGFYRNGFGVQQDYDLAETNLLLASKTQKISIADLYLLYLEEKPNEEKANLYKQKILIEKNLPSIVMLDNKFCPVSISDAMFDLFSNSIKKATSNESGDKAKECFIWKKAYAHTGSLIAARVYANFLIRGYGTETNKLEGAAWMINAMQRGDAKSKENYEKIKKDFSLDELTKAEQRAKEINNLFAKK